MTNAFTETAICQTAAKFLGKTPTEIDGVDGIPELPMDLGNNLTRFIRDYVADNCPDLSWDLSAGMFRLLNLFEPTHSIDAGANRIAYWPDLAKRERSHVEQLTMEQISKLRAMGKPGKAFKRFFPEASPEMVAGFVDEYNREYSPTRYTIKSGQSRADFRKAYNGEMVAFQNPYLVGFRKSLSNSCMRGYYFEQWGKSPAECYASGDFTILFVVDSDDKIAARVVVRTHEDGEEIETPCYAPIYGCTDIAIEFLETRLNEMGAIPARDHSESNGFIGAKLARIEYRGGFLMAYSDISPQSARDIGDYLVIDSCGDISMSTTSGIAEDDESCQCHECNDRIDLEESYSDDYGRQFCEDCYHERFGICDNCEDTVSRNDLETVRIESRRNDHESWCPHCVRTDSTECEDGINWRDSDVIESGCGCSLSPEDIDSGNWTICEDGEYYRESLCGETEDGEYRLIEDLESEGLERSNNGIWFYPESHDSYMCAETPDLLSAPDTAAPAPDTAAPAPAPAPDTAAPDTAAPDTAAPAPETVILSTGETVGVVLLRRIGANGGVVMFINPAEYSVELRGIAISMIARAISANRGDLISTVRGVCRNNGTNMFFGVAYEYGQARHYAESVMNDFHANAAIAAE